MWQIGASAKEFGRLDEYARQFDILEIDVEKAFKLGLGPVFSIAESAEPFKDRIRSLHLRYNQLKGASCDGVQTSIYDLEFFNRSRLKDAIEIYVTHTDYPQNREQLYEQMQRLGEAAAQQDVIVAVENLGDRKNKTNGYMAPRNPREIAELLDEIGNEHLGLCLDTGHALSNAGLTDSLVWDTDAARKWLRHVHYNDNLFRMDDHMPISSATSEYLIAGLKLLLDSSQHDGFVILEHRNLVEAVQSMHYMQTPAYVGIAPAPMR
jgi:hypothetical protein